MRDLAASPADLPRLTSINRPAREPINAKDGAKDTIGCGTGNDRVTVDAIDVVSSNCEQGTG
jgi:hypothetical protein